MGKRGCSWRGAAFGAVISFTNARSVSWEGGFESSAWMVIWTTLQPPTRQRHVCGHKSRGHVEGRPVRPTGLRFFVERKIDSFAM